MNNNHFQSARLKLTVFYLVIIMLVSSFFSVLVFRVSTAEMERGMRFQAQRVLPRTQIYPLFSLNAVNNWYSFFWPFSDTQPDATLNFYREAYEAGVKRLAWQLLYLNIAILLLAGGAGWFLAGRTLKPIALMLEEQKQFVADASHELRTPLAAMKSEIEVALRDKDLETGEARELLASNLEEVDKLKSLTDYFLVLNKYQSDHKGSDLTIFNLSDVWEEAVKRWQKQISEKKIELKKNYQEVMIKAGRSSLMELGSLLLDNAIKYSQKGGNVELSVLNQYEWAMLKIKDEGCGIKQEDQTHIFDRFFRSDRSRSKDKTKGYGLGLAIAKNIVDLHQGKIEVQSEFGKGTVFTVRLPITF